MKIKNVTLSENELKMLGFIIEEVNILRMAYNKLVRETLGDDALKSSQKVPIFIERTITDAIWSMSDKVEENIEPSQGSCEQDHST